MLYTEKGLVLSIFMIAQLLDGGLTYLGVRQLGLEVEANLLLSTAMEAWGAAPTLFGAKSVACACGFILHRLARHRVLAVAAGAYIGLAVVPWLLALLNLA